MVSKEEKDNIIIQGKSDSSLTIMVNGELQEIKKEFSAFREFLEKMAAQSKSVQSANKIYNISSITNANFSNMVEQVGRSKALPAELADDLFGEGDGWIESLRQELEENQKISVKNKTSDVFQNYGWLVETFLQKMRTAAGRNKNLRRLSFMAEVWQASLRYLCYIQVAQFIQSESKNKLGVLSDFLQMKDKQYLDFNYTSLLLTITDAIGANSFMHELHDFVDELDNKDASLFDINIYLEDKRTKLMANKIEEDETLPALLEEYLTALVYWLRKISFLAKYRLVSIKDINLDYRLGTTRNFVHLYGELHGIYSDGDLSSEDYSKKSIEGAFTYNKSVLLFKGANVSIGLDGIQEQTNYLSLSPLVIDQSVYSGTPKQTPEIFYYSGYDKDKKQYSYAQYKNELAYGGKDDIPSNKSLKVKAQNNNQFLLNKLFKQLEDVFESIKN